MPPSPIPAPLPPWARWLLQLAPLINVGLQEALQYIGAMEDNTAAEPDTWRHVQLIWEITGNVDPANRMVNTLDIVNVTNGAVDNSWTDTDYSTVHAAVSGLVASYLASAPTCLKILEYRYYRRSFNPLTDPRPFTKSGPPEKVFQGGQLGTLTGNGQAPQVAATHTERTTYPRHWGRSYWPMPSPATVNLATGHFGQPFTDALANAVETTFQTLQNSEFFPVVPVTQVDRVPTRGLLGVTHVQVDDIPDVVRRRRPKAPNYRKIIPPIV